MNQTTRLIVFLFAFCLQAFAHAQQPGFTVQGTINADYEGPVLMIVERDSLIGNASNRHFTISGTVEYPKLVTVTIPGSFCGSRFYLENSNIQLTLNASYRENLKKYCAQINKVSGSVSDSLYKAFRNKKEKAIAAAPNRKDAFVYRPLVIEFIKTNPGLGYSAELISDNMGSYGLAWAKDMYALLNANALRTEQAILLKSMLRQRESDKPGNAFQDFTMERFDGSTFNSASLRGKYVLYDFWASWCIPCRKENAILLPSYNKYKGKLFEVVSISLDDNKDKWGAAIEKDGLTWIHVSELKAWKSQLVLDHSIMIIPYNILVDPEGTIIAVNLRGNKLEKKLKEIFEQ